MKFEEIKLGKKESPSMIPIALVAAIFPLSIVFWIFNYFAKIISSDYGEPRSEFGDESHLFLDRDDITPSRWLMSFAFPIIFTAYGVRRKSINFSGALTALFVGFFLTLSSYCFLMCLLIFFLTSSKATKFRGSRKKVFEEDYKEGGQRNWIQVLCNGSMATELAILYLLDVGFGERAIDFAKDYRASWLGIGILGALSCANGDTWASELGTVITTTVPRLVTTLRSVPKGTNGAVTLGGLVFSFLGGLVIGLGYYLTVIFTVDSSLLRNAPPQWPLILVGAIGGLLGSIIDSFMGATLQFSGSDTQGKIYETPGSNIKKISGFCVLDNHSVNLLSTILTALLLPSIAISTWP